MALCSYYAALAPISPGDVVLGPICTELVPANRPTQPGEWTEGCRSTCERRDPREPVIMTWSTLVICQ